MRDKGAPLRAPLVLLHACHRCGLNLDQIRRVAERDEVAAGALAPVETPGAALAEAPICRNLQYRAATGE